MKQKLFIFTLLLAAMFSGMKRADAQLTRLVDFTKTYAPNQGGPPDWEQNVIQVDEYLYGLTYYGGLGDFGVLYKVKPDGTSYSVVYNFGVSGTVGIYPTGSLIYDGTYFYGMTNMGGTNSSGVVFKIKPDGTSASVVANFYPYGAQPHGSLYSDGTFLYGMTTSGVTAGKYGNIFKVKPDGTSFANLHIFTGGTDGASPYGSLVSDGTYLFGMTSDGGSGNLGTIFKIKPDGTSYAIMHTFLGSAFDGADPFGTLIYQGGFLYGLTNSGGLGYSYNCGTMFKIKPDATSFALVHLFDPNTPNTEGINPCASLAWDGTFFYGTTPQRNATSDGTIFKIKPDGTSFTGIAIFGDAGMGISKGTPLIIGNTLYGAVSYSNTAYYAGSVYKSGILINQVITFNTLPVKTYLNPDFAPGATSSSGLTVTYTSSNPAVATIVAGLIHIVGAGSCTIYADQAGNTTYDPALQASQILTVNKANQTISASALPAKNVGDPDFSLDATASSLLAVVYSSSNTSVATITGNMVHLVGPGTCNIYCDQPGDANFNPAARVTLSLAVNKLTQYIDFAALAVKTYGDPDFSANASASSGLIVTLSSSNTSVATIVSNFIHIVNAGSCTIYANQAGNATYAAANQVSQSVTVNKAPLIAKADDKSRNVGQMNPGFTITYTGFVLGENSSVINTPAYSSCSANFSSPAGTYPIIPSGASDNDYTFTYVNGTLTITALPLNTWTGAISTDWGTGNNWSTGLMPDFSQDVRIPSAPLNQPHITNQYGCNALTIDAGASVTVEAGKMLYVNSTLTNNGTVASLVVENGGTLWNNTPGVLATIKRLITNTKSHFLSSPVAATTFGSIFPGNPLNIWAREWNPVTNSWVFRLSADACDYHKGYTVSTTGGSYTATFKGVVNASDVTSLPLSNLNGGWNLLGNPFPCPIDWDMVTKGSGVSAAASVWNGTNYVSWNGAVGALTDGIIPAENGFYVTTNTNGSTVTIPMMARTMSAIPFYKESVANVLEIRAEGNGTKDATFIHFNNDATAGYDNQFDAIKLWGEDEAPQLYSISGDQVLNINELPMQDNEVVSLGFKCGISGEYSLSASGMESFDAATPVLLEDMRINFTQDMRANPIYNFSYSAGENDKRFKLHFKSANGINDPAISGISIFSVENTVTIKNTSNLVGEVWVYDMTGHLLAQFKLSNHTITSIPLLVSQGNYIVKVVTALSSINEKIFIR